MKDLSLKELQQLYENADHRAKIDSENWVKQCTGGSGESKLEGFTGCGGRFLPLYEFPIIKQYSKGIHSYIPDQDGVVRRSTCRACLREYNNLIAKNRRSQTFDKSGALSELSRYIKTRFKADPITNPIYIRVRSEAKDLYKYSEMERIKDEIREVAKM